jgi:AcrR family transcriptional regulator
MGAAAHLYEIFSSSEDRFLDVSLFGVGGAWRGEGADQGGDWSKHALVLPTRTRERVDSPERARIVEAVIEIGAESGYLDSSIDAIVDRAGVDRAAFDRHFRGKYDSFLSAWQQVNEECMEEILGAFNSEEDWPARLRAVARQVVDSLQHDPARGVFAVEVLVAGHAARARRDMTMRVIASLIDAGRSEMEDPDSVPRTTAEALAGAAYGQIYAMVIAGSTDGLSRLVPQLTAAAVMPYLGVEAGMEELSRGAEMTGQTHPPDRPNGHVDASLCDQLELTLSSPDQGRLQRALVARDQRELLIAGLADAAAEHGYAATTIAHITRSAVVSRRTFYEYFAGKDECSVAAYDWVMGELRERIGRAAEGAGDWPHAVKAGIGAMLRFFAAEPNLARLVMVDAPAAGPVLLEQYDAAIQSLFPYLRLGRDGHLPETPASHSATIEKAVVGGMVTVISSRIHDGEVGELEFLLPGLVEFTLTPYLGAAEAARIAHEG